MALPRYGHSTPLTNDSKTKESQLNKERDNGERWTTTKKEKQKMQMEDNRQSSEKDNHTMARSKAERQDKEKDDGKDNAFAGVRESGIKTAGQWEGHG